MTPNTTAPDSVDAKILDTTESRYDLVKLAVAHVNILKRAPELSAWHVPQLIKKSLFDILSGNVKPEEILAARKKQLDEDDKPADVIAAASAAVKKQAAEHDTKDKPVKKKPSDPDKKKKSAKAD